MNEVFLKLKNSLTGKWQGEGFAQYPTIDNTKYTERLAFTPDEFKDVVHFEQKTLYRNNTEKNGHTVFWDTGFILLKDNKILMVSSQLSGRQETYELVRNTQVNFVFESIHIENDAKGTIRSQRVFTISEGALAYELNMASRGLSFQNHLSATLQRVG